MNVLSTCKYARISAFKAREVTREIQGLPVSQALDILAFTPRKAALLVAKTLKSAIANAENNNNLRAETLVVREAVVGEGPTMKRFIPKARGSAGPIRKRTAHIRIIVTDEIEIKQREPNKPSKKKNAPKSKAKAKATEPIEAVKEQEIPITAEAAEAEAGAPSAPETSIPGAPANTEDQVAGE
jgi:large subunit ribosomal protein L22